MLKFFKSKQLDEKIPDDFASKCKKCNTTHLTTILNSQYHVCPSCGDNIMRTPRQILDQTFDKESFKQLYSSKRIHNPLRLEGYTEKQKQIRDKFDIDESVTTGIARIEGMKVAVAIMDPRYLMGSLGTRAGEKLTMLTEYATTNKLPLLIFTASGGARMQEGILSLMQMSKVVSSIRKHSEQGLFYMPILMNPTTGGVTASFAQLGDFIIAEDRALICFAGPKVIEKTINQKLPEGFQRSEFLLEHGFLDAVVERKKQRLYIANVLRLHGVKNG